MLFRSPLWLAVFPLSVLIPPARSSPSLDVVLLFLWVPDCDTFRGPFSARRCEVRFARVRVPPCARVRGCCVVVVPPHPPSAHTGTPPGLFQTVFDPMFIAVYNLFYTSMPVLALAVFDQDVKERQSLTYPKLYVRVISGGVFIWEHG